MPAKPLLKPKRNRTQFSAQNWEDIPENIIGQENAPLPDEPPDALPAAPVRSATPWELYNEKAKLYDREMLREWEENLTILLIFASLFSAVLTAFIIASMPLLQDDPNGAMRDILITISKQLGNSSTPAYQSSEFSAPTWAVHVNFLFFASLGSSLVAALASVLALQWIRDYDVGLARVAIPRERALRRHFRFEGVQKWWMPEIIAVLPTLLHIALLLFLGGLVEWLVHIHLIVSVTMVAALSVGGTFYIFTQVCAAMWPSAPFRTPISRFLETNGVLIYANLYRPMEKLWNHASTRPTRNLDVKQETDAVLSKMKITKPRFREEIAIQSDVLIPSSALSWLLGHVERSTLSVPYIGDIMRALTVEEGISTISQPNLQEKAEWAEIIEWFVGQLERFRRQGCNYPPHIEDDFFSCSQIAAVLGEGSLLPTTDYVTRGFPFDKEGSQTSWLGVSLRFALWRNHSPFTVDSANPPLSLFKAISQNISFSAAALIVYLQEIRSCMVNGELSALEVISCISTLMHSSQSPRGFNHSHYHEIFRIEMYTTTIHALGMLAGVRNPGATPRTESEGIERILDMYRLRGGGDPWPSEANQLFESLFVFLAALNHPLAPNARSMRLPMTPLLAHSAFIQLWGDKIVGDSQPFTFSTVNQLIEFSKREIGTALYVKCRLPAYIASWVLQNAFFSVSSVVPGTLEWDSMVADLTLLADSCRKLTARKDVTSSSNDPSPILSMADSFAWVQWILKGLDLEMSDDGFSMITTLLLSLWTRASLDETLHCPVTPERLEELANLGSPNLIIIGCVIMGWEYERFILPDEDDAWESLGWKMMILGLLTSAPFNRLTSDAALLLAISRHRGPFFDELILLSCDERTPTLTYVDEPGTNSPIAQVMQAMIPAFTNNLQLPYGRIESLLDRWSNFPSFYEHFVTANGLDWLVAIRRQSEDQQIPPPDLWGNHEDHQFFNLSQQTRGKDGIRSLSADGCQRVLHSPIICDYPNDVVIHAELLDHITACYRHMQGFGVMPVFREAGSVCSVILNHTIIAESCYGSRLSEGVHHGHVIFDNWCTEMRELIAGLRGEQVEIVIGRDVPEEVHSRNVNDSV